MEVILAQLTPVESDVGANVEQARRVVELHPDADLVVFPELFLSGTPAAGYADCTLSPDGPELRALCDAAGRCSTGVVIGAPVTTAAGPVNAAIAIGPHGEVAGICAKTHQWDTEGAVFRAGAALAPLPLAGLRVGAMVCFDVEFPEVARTLALRGADVLVTIAANMEPFGPDHATFARARALENGLPHVYVNRTGSEAGNRYVGESCAIGPDGEVLVAAGADPRVLRATLHPGAARADERVAYLGQRRPELYGALAVADPNQLPGLGESPIAGRRCPPDDDLVR